MLGAPDRVHPGSHTHESPNHTPSILQDKEEKLPNSPLRFMPPPHHPIPLHSWECPQPAFGHRPWGKACPRVSYSGPSAKHPPTHTHTPSSNSAPACGWQAQNRASNHEGQRDGTQESLGISSGLKPDSQHLPGAESLQNQEWCGPGSECLTGIAE